jgi:hypothetical protein
VAEFRRAFHQRGQLIGNVESAGKPGTALGLLQGR